MATDTMPRTPRTVPGRGSDPKTARPRKVTAPRHTRPEPRPGTGPRPGTRPGTRPVPRTSRPRARSSRTPFILLLVGLLGGALVSLLVISTTLAQGAFRITSLQEQNANLAREQQTLTNEVAQAANPAVIEGKAEQLGMRPNPHLGFIDQKTGKIIVGKPSRAEAAIDVPGYTP
ncbi:MAG TPA: hypothetical protein VFQ68_32605 [Streptosporangiaceae bacterium]|nr:hypothetical protein [Streptosporangiaceae bacterium]